MKHGIVKRHMYIFLVFLTPLLLLADKEVLVDLSLQKAYALEDGKVLFEGRISSGKSDHETPTGSFKILQKQRTHTSNLYPEPNGGAEMPYMMRLTWDGIAIHQGYTPGYPVSHGCIRIQRKFAKKLFAWTSKGTPVTIEGDTSWYSGDTDNVDVSTSRDRDGYTMIEVY